MKFPVQPPGNPYCGECGIAMTGCFPNSSAPTWALQPVQYKCTNLRCKQNDKVIEVKPRAVRGEWK